VPQALLDVARHRRREAAADGGSAEAGDGSSSGGGSLAGYAHGWPEPPAWEAGVLRLFADSADAPYSIHRITLEGAAQGTPVGRWLGPASIAQALTREPAVLYVGVASSEHTFSSNNRC
jgi:hypothetical protein